MPYFFSNKVEGLTFAVSLLMFLAMSILVEGRASLFKLLRVRIVIPFLVTAFFNLEGSTF
jgi:hypothetical protein